MSRTVLKNDFPYLKAAFADLGLSEIIGKKHEKRVLAMYADAGHSQIKDDETAWCAAAVGAWLKRGGEPNTKSLMARSYTKYGVACAANKRVPRGAIAVWPRGKPPSGHVNIVLEDDGEFVTCIGGNQSNGAGGGVTISRERKSHAVAFRMPPGAASAAKAVSPPKTKPLALLSDVEEPMHAEPLPASVETVDRSGIVQDRLKALGYHEVGDANSTFGPRTVGAIAAFKKDRNLPGEPVIDDALLAELDKALAESWKRPIAVERAEATAAEVGKKIETVAAGQQNKFLAWIIGIPSAITAFVKGVADNFEEALSSPFLNHVKEFFADNIALLAVGVVGIAAAIWWNGRRTVTATKEAYNTGRLVS